MSFAALAKPEAAARGPAKVPARSSRLRVGEPGDAFEREADQVADRVLTTGSAKGAWSISLMSIDSPLQRKCDCGGTGDCDSCKKKGTLQRKPQSASQVAETAPASVDRALAGSGRPLDSNVSATMGERFGYDFSRVRVHSDGVAQQSAHDVRAKAYTVGHNVVFGSGQYSPSTRQGQRLIAHELTHVVQQESTGGVSGASGEMLLQRYSDDDATGKKTVDAGSDTETPTTQDTDDDSATVTEPIKQGTEYKRELEAEKEAASQLGEEAPYAARIVMFLTIEPSDAFESAEDFIVYAQTKADLPTGDQAPGAESALLDSLETTAPTILDRFPQAFPYTWAERMREQLSIDEDKRMARVASERSRETLDQSGNRLASQVFEHGLPVGFAASSNLKTVELLPLLWVIPFMWFSLPGNDIDKTWPPLVDFLGNAANYLNALDDANVYNLWAENAKKIVVKIQDGEAFVDPEAYRADIKRGQSIASYLGGLSSNPFAGLGNEPAGGNGIDPAAEKQYLASLAMIVAFGESYSNRRLVADLAGKYLGDADKRIADESGSASVDRAQEWGWENGFYGDAAKEGLRSFWDNKLEIAAGIGKDLLIGAALNLIFPGLGLLYMDEQLAEGAIQTGEALISAAEEAADARSVIQLQHAAAHLAAEWMSIVGQVTLAAGAHLVGKALKDTPEKTSSEGGTGKVPAADPSDVSGQTNEPTRKTDNPAVDSPEAKEPAGHKHEGTNQQDATRLERDKLPNEPRILLDKVGGEARVTEEGRCKICHSPCQYELDKMRDLMDAAAKAGDAFAFRNAENLLKRIQHLEAAMEAARRRNIPNAEFESRFKGALKALSNAVDDAALKPNTGEIKRPRFGKDRGIVDDPAWYDDHAESERAGEGTAYHDHIREVVERELPKGTVLTENTIKVFFENHRISPKAIEAMFGRKKGIDLYIIDHERGVVTPVDITGSGGVKSHVRKLGRDFDKVKAGFESIGLHMNEPIEVDYRGMTFKEASADIVSELRALAYI